MKKMSFFCLVLFIAIGCAGKMEKRLFIDEFGTMKEAENSFRQANDPENWKSFEVPMEAVFCTKEKPVCTRGKVYQITKYLPKKFLGYQYVIFENDKGENEIFLIDNLPYQSDRENIKNKLDKINP